MSDKVVSTEQLRSKLDLLRSALHQPRLYVNNYLEELINEIDIQSQMALDNEETDQKELLNLQEKMINRITEFKETCLSNLTVDQVCKENLQTKIDKIQRHLISDKQEMTVEEIIKDISNNLLKIQKAVFMNKSIHYIRNSDCFDMVISDNEKQSSLGKVFIIEGDLINKETLKAV